MSNAVKHVMLRVIKRRLEDKESLERIFKDFPRLSSTDRQELQNELGIDQEHPENYVE